MELFETESKKEENKMQSEKLRHFDFKKCIIFWDDFNFELYIEVLKAKKIERL